jgi:hypothetical protein
VPRVDGRRDSLSGHRDRNPPGREKSRWARDSKGRKRPKFTPRESRTPERPADYAEPDSTTAPYAPGPT